MFGVPLKLYWLQFCTSLTIQLKSFSNVGLSPPLSVLSTTIFMTIRLNSFKIQNVFNFYFSLCAAKRLNHFQILTRPFFLIRFPAVNWYKFKETTIFMHVGGKSIVLRVLTSVLIHVHSASIQSFFLPVHTSEKVNPNILCVIDDRLTTNINETNCKVLSHMRQVLWKGDSWSATVVEIVVKQLLLN